MSFEQTKKEILNKITNDVIDEALELIKSLLPQEGKAVETFERLSYDFTNQANNFNYTMFKAQLKVLVNNLAATTTPIAAKPAEKTDTSDKLYDELCSIDFETQTTHFRNIYRRKNVSAFLLYGENNEDTRWLYHQLMHLEGLTMSKPESIDYSSTVNSTFEQLQQQLFDRFDVTNKQVKTLRFKIESFLQTSPLVILIKYPARKITELNEFYKSFFDLFKLLYDQISEEKNPVIFLFIEDALTEYDAIDKTYFLWQHGFQREGEYSLAAINEQTPKIMDLAPICKLKPDEVEKWLAKKLSYQQLQKFYCDVKQELNIPDEGASPYYIIDQICNAIKTDPSQKTDQWLIH
jgi:hypothetical protein